MDKVSYQIRRRDPAPKRSMAGEGFRGPTLLDQQHVVGLELGALLHTGSTDRHAWDREADRLRPLGNEALDVGPRHMAFDDITVNHGGVAGGELVADARLSLQRRKRAWLSRVHLHGEAVHLKMLDPGAATFAGRRFPDLD